MDEKLMEDIMKSNNVIIQSNDPSFNYVFLKQNDIDDFHKLPEIIELSQYDYSFKRDEGTDTKLPSLTPASLLISSNNLYDTEEWYRQKYPNLPDEYHAIMARYSTGNLLTKRELNKKQKKSKKKDKEEVKTLQVSMGKFSLSFD